MNLYPADKIYEEAAFVAYYMHWGREEIFNLTHNERLKWCREISEINRKVSSKPPEKDIFRI
ncbi:MAG: hypothetical protein HFH37_08585 [Lachnospiraceae bacterium]|nr:hypothetical protein [Lachnospiraceae bacterium]